MSVSKAMELSKLVEGLLPTDEGAFIVFGSLARREYTADSDLDWTVLIDGRAASGHLGIVHELKQKLKDAQFKVPGPTEVFGGLVFSHELVHAIGGDDDTNKNMTRRLLLLLESTAIETSSSKEVQSRILNAILGRYVDEDASFIAGNRRNDRIPRFLLNDVVRFWRTIAVDYANKYRARAGEKWALRNIKLRMSRKLIFVSGLFMCISWALRDNEDTQDDFVVQKLVTHLKEWAQRPPLESIAKIILTYAPSLAPAVFDNYDAFLGILDDKTQRMHLEGLSPEDAYEDDVFMHARGIATKFDEALTALLFESDEQITKLVKKYGVF
ncbi:nucleotidyltransferase domain-containing protein [Rhizobium sp. BK376]|uniref:nucleotidyltransferase domain-containing protein n=1 Tax=Rhizobium sp. BK376 TaxID=2512149 RepID=UPI00104C625B|nr:nucleotidyltransferase domain-containing protein [Rhizobium sp. BK376]